VGRGRRILIASLGVGVYVVFSGPPGSGKSTLAAALAAELGLPLLAKDTIKEGLLETIGAADVDASQHLGAASVTVLLAMARDNGCGVLESTWRRSLATGELQNLPGRVIEVFCACPPEVARQRFAERAPTRHPGHFDAAHLEANDLWSGDRTEPVAGGWPVLRIDTSAPVDIGDVRQRITALENGPART
jgi:predicted kinase